MNRHPVHMRDQKASIVVMDNYRRQQVFQDRLEYFIIVTAWAMAVFTVLS